MPTPSLIIRRARAAPRPWAQPAPGEGPLGIVEDAAIAVAGAEIVYVGAEAGLPQPAPGPRPLELGARGMLVTPGYIEPHSHLLFAGDRASEFARRLSGATYQEIAAAGGGMLATVRATRAASDDELVLSAKARIRR